MAEVLVTGGSGYIGAHVVNECLNAGYTVRATVRDPNNPLKVDPLKKLGKGREDRLKIVKADLFDSQVWKGLIKGCKYVLHVASVVNFEASRDEEVIKTSTEGTRNVLKGAVEAGGVQRFVFTSSVAAIGFATTHILSEDDWAEATPGSIEDAAYARGKTIAERDVWDFVKELPDENKFELVVLNPSFVFGPPLTTQSGVSMDIGKSFLDPVPMVPKFMFPCVDVRDVAEAHVIALTRAEAAGQRILITDKSWWFAAIREFLNEEFSQHGYHLSSRIVPRWLLSVIVFLSSDATAKTGLTMWNNQAKYDNSKMKTVLGMNPRCSKQAIIDMAYELIECGYVNKKSTYKGRPSSSAGKEN